MTTDISEKALESLIVEHLTTAGGYSLGSSKDYDRAHAVDLPQLLAFLEATQPTALAKFKLAQEGTSRTEFLARLQKEIASRGVIEVLRSGVKPESSPHISPHNTAKS